MAHIQYPLPIRRVTPDDGHYFFGYFDKYQVDVTGRYLLVNKAAFMDRPPTADDTLELGLCDLADDGRYRRLTETRAWNFQQGCMLQWLPGGAPTEFFYNDRRDGRFVAVKADIHRGELAVWPAPIYCVSPDGRWAATPNFARLAAERPGYGYEGVPDPFAEQPYAGADGIQAMDLRTGQVRHLVSQNHLAQVPPIRDTFGHGSHWTNHLLISPDSKRLMFLHRWRVPGGGHLTRLYTIARDGSDLCLLNDCDMTSHMWWLDPQHIVAFANRDHWGYYEFTDRGDQVEEIGAGLFDDDGHCTCSRDGEWMLTDTYWDKVTSERTLILYHRPRNIRFDIARLWGNSRLPVPVRCDFHPRFSRDESFITIDSLHEGFRGVYVIDCGKKP